jgi:ribosomal protein L7/L12
VLEHVRNGDRLKAVVALRELRGLGLGEAKQIVDEL